MNMLVFGSTIEESVDELKPCPWCNQNETNVWYDQVSADDEAPFVVCCEFFACEAASPRCATREQAIKVWNKFATKYERLKRLDDNIKKIITSLKYSHVDNKPTPPIMLPLELMSVDVNAIIELLESLDNV